MALRFGIGVEISKSKTVKVGEMETEEREDVVNRWW